MSVGREDSHSLTPLKTWSGSVEQPESTKRQIIRAKLMSFELFKKRWRHEAGKNTRAGLYLQ